MNNKIVLVLVAALLPVAASANVLTINSPDVRKGEASIEAGLRWEFDRNKSQDHFREYALEVEYSPTDFWGVGFEFVPQREQGQGTRYAVTSFEHTLQFLKQGKGAPFSLGMRAEFEKSHLSGEADELAARLLFRYRDEHKEVRLNIGGDREVGSYAGRGVVGDVRASFRYRLNEYLMPALDYLGDTGRLDDMPRYSRQEHLLGPVLYGTIPDMPIGFQVGYLAGISRAAADHTFKLALEYEF